MDEQSCSVCGSAVTGQGEVCCHCGHRFGNCSDCGTTKSWFWSSVLENSNYCRDDLRKSGSFTNLIIDPDKLEKLVGRDMAVRIATECLGEYEGR